MTHENGVRTGLLDTISSLRLCNQLQAEVIENMEHYQTTVENAAEDGKYGRRFGYEAELTYLHDRREALDSLIDAVERYGAVSEGGLLAEHLSAGK